MDLSLAAKLVLSLLEMGEIRKVYKDMPTMDTQKIPY